MKLFGITGGIGMGKTTAGGILRKRGLPVVDTDELAREVVAPGQPALEEIKSTFGGEVISSDGTLHRRRLAEIVFANPVARQKLESITHPRIRDRWRAQVSVWRAEGHAMAVVVIPLLFETGAETELDFSVCIACSSVTQLERLRPRGWSTEQIQQRIVAQWPVEKKVANANYVVWTEGTVEVMSGQLDRIFRC